MQRIVLTGGPGAGKTVISRAVAQRYPQRFVTVPEAATQVYQQLGTRWDLLDNAGRRDVQRRIFFLQVEQEDRLHQAHPDKILLLDRGTVDGAAYWPDGPADYWRDLQTSLEQQLHRYDAAIFLESCAAIGLYDGAASNACRFEDETAALACQRAIESIWLPHPCLHRVAAFEDLHSKIVAVERLLIRLAA